MRSHRRRPPLVLGLFLLACLAPPSRAQCPETLVAIGGIPSTRSTAAVFDTVGSVGEAHWNAPDGVVYMYSYGSLGGVRVDAFDDFDVTGVAPGTPVALTAVLTIDGAVWTSGCGGSGCGGYYKVDFFHGADSVGVVRADHLFFGRAEHHDVLTLPLTVIAGQAERLRIRAFGARSPGGAHPSDARCVLTFRVPSEDVGIRSCKGYAGTLVPVARTSWGRLKTIYR